MPGSCIYSIILSKSRSLKKLDINSTLIKLTFYPIFSFSFVGILVLILDQIGLIENFIFLSLIIALPLLYLVDIGIQTYRGKTQFSHLRTYSIRSSVIIILVLMIGIILISLGIFFGRLYLFGEDDWVGVNPALYIGKDSLNALNNRIHEPYYPAFWGYVIFGFGKLSGLPFINTNALLAPFCYLFVSTSYIFFKVILKKQKEDVVILATILMIIFSGAFSIKFNIFVHSISELIIRNEFHFIYKSFSYITLFLSMALFIHTSKRNHLRSNTFLGLTYQEWGGLILSTFFLIMSFISYMIPVLMGIVLIFLYCCFSKNKARMIIFKLFCIWISIFFVFFLVFDVLMNFYLTYTALYRFLTLFRFEFLYNIFNLIPFSVLGYTFIGLFLTINFLLYFIFNKIKNLSTVKFNINNRTKKILYLSFLVIFSSFTFIYILEFFIYLTSDNFLFLAIYMVFSRFGLIGIIYIYFSIWFFKSKNKTFSFLFFWLIFSLVNAIIPVFLEFLLKYNLNYQTFYASLDYWRITYWLRRVWFYAIPSMCIFGAYGIYRLVSYIDNLKILKGRTFPNVSLKLAVFSIITILSYSGIVSTAMTYGIQHFRITDEKVEMIGYISENLPYDSNLLAYQDFHIRYGMKMTYTNYIYFETLPQNPTSMINELKERDLQYALVSWEYLSLNQSYFNLFNNTLVADFYNQTLFRAGELELYYAPYFNQT